MESLDRLLRCRQGLPRKRISRCTCRTQVRRYQDTWCTITGTTSRRAKSSIITGSRRRPSTITTGITASSNTSITDTTRSTACVQRESPRRRRLVAEEPTNERQFPIGFLATNIAPGAEEDIEVKPQVYFRGERLAIPPTIARYFDILDIKVGKDSQLAATGTMPGESFSALAVGARMELDTAKPGIVITIRVRNVDTVAHDFKAIMYGAVLARTRSSLKRNDQL